MKKIVLGILAIFTCGLLCGMTPVFAADDNTVSCTCANGEQGTAPETAILDSDTVCDCGNGEAVISILELVIDIMTIGIGILGVIGITVVGIQYLTAGGDTGKVQKSKQRMLEIVIGLAIYVVIYALLKWLLPGFSL